jgi:hypothetical protein
MREGWGNPILGIMKGWASLPSAARRIGIPILGMLSAFFFEFACLWVFRKFQ